MELSLKKKILDYRKWLNEGECIPQDAACLILGMDPDTLIIKNPLNYREIEILDESINILTDQFCQNFGIWWKLSFSIFVYVNLALKNNVKVNRTLLDKTKNYYSGLIDEDKSMFIEKYPYISRKLNIAFIKNEEDSIEVRYFKQIIDEVYRKFWSNVDPNRPTKSEIIIKWILDNFNVSKKTAEVVDSMVRPEKYKNGGNRSLKKLK